MKRTLRERDGDEKRARTSGRADSRRQEPSAERPSRAERLQQAGGNSTVQALAERGALRPKLSVGGPDDRAEREADRVADAVVDGPAQGSQSTAAVRRSDDAAATGDDATTVDAETSDRIRSLRGGGRPLPDAERTFFESRFGREFDDVRVHTGSRADEAARSVDARAFALGSDLVFANGSYEPGTDRGRRLLAHELTHVVQDDSAERLRRWTTESTSTVTEENGKGKKENEDGKYGSISKGTVQGNMWGDPVESDVTVESHSIAGWQTLLKNASTRTNALELNAFMALSVGEDLYLATYDESERKGMASELAGMEKPGREERAKLMVAMLTTKGIDLEDTTVVGTAGGFLLPKFVDQNLGYAVAKIQQKSEQKGGYAEYSVKPGAVQGLLSQAGAAWADVKDLYTPGYTAHGKYTHRDVPAEDNMDKLGTSGPPSDRSPQHVLVAQATAGAQSAAFGAIISAMAHDDPDQRQAAQERFKRQIEQYGRMLSGVAMEQERIKKRNEALIGGAVDTAFAALGPLGGGLSIGKQIGKSTAVGAVKNASMTMAGGLAGPGGEAARDRFLTAFWIGLEEYTSEMLRKEDMEFPEDFGDLKDQLKGAFERGLNL